MTTFDDVRKTIEATIGNLTPAKAQELAKSLSDPETAKEQVAKLAADMLEWSQRNRDRLRGSIGREISNQLTSMGVASRAELDAVKKRVRELERAAGMTASGRASAAKKPAARKLAAKKLAARAPAPKKPAATGDA